MRAEKSMAAVCTVERGIGVVGSKGGLHDWAWRWMGSQQTTHSGTTHSGTTHWLILTSFQKLRDQWLMEASASQRASLKVRGYVAKELSAASPPAEWTDATQTWGLIVDHLTATAVYAYPWFQNWLSGGERPILWLVGQAQPLAMPSPSSHVDWVRWESHLPPNKLVTLVQWLAPDRDLVEVTDQLQQLSRGTVWRMSSAQGDAVETVQPSATRYPRPPTAPTVPVEAKSEPVITKPPSGSVQPPSGSVQPPSVSDQPSAPSRPKTFPCEPDAASVQGLVKVWANVEVERSEDSDVESTLAQLESVVTQAVEGVPALLALPRIGVTERTTDSRTKRPKLLLLFYVAPGDVDCLALLLFRLLRQLATERHIHHGGVFV